jgi:hypothetical protein
MKRIAFVAVWLIAIVAAPSAQSVERFVPYSGSKLTSLKVLLCTSDKLAAGGYWFDTDKDVFRQGAMISPQGNLTTWRITFRSSNEAEVIRFSGAGQTLEEPEIYSVEVTESAGLLLVWKNRPQGHSPQVITIDPLSSSFVYSTQFADATLLRWNRANVFYGSCRPYA